MDGVRVVVDGRRRWGRQHFAVAVAAAGGGSGNDEDHREENDDKLKGLSFSGQTLQAEKKNPAGGREELAKVPGGENNLKAGKSEPNFEKDKATSVVNPANPTGIQELADLSLTVAGDSQNPKHAEHGLFNANSRLVGGVSKNDQTEGENGRRNQPSPPPSPKEGTEVGLSKPLGLTEKRIPIPVEENLRPRDGSHSHKKEMLQKKDSSEHEEGETISSDTQRSASKEIPEATTPLSTSKSGSGIAGSTVEKGGANNPQPPAASVTQHNSEGDTGPAALPASTSELQTEEIPNAGIIATTYDDGNDDSSPATSTAERPTGGTRSTQASGDASDLERTNNDDVNDDVVHNGKAAEFETASGDRDTQADNNEIYTTVPENATNKTINTEITADSDGSTVVSHTTTPLLLLLVVCAAAGAVVAA
ncbi:mucin-associated surface protein [Trypanosoma cruzi]|uniref:Mucin-associated surface protein n=1 Tax=Trypanosoma cruzi TaxID=5693 RepID=A0A7J6XNL1_TRYCR|nr:mucin-associated surface protein [Trypanosoma cruzi]